MPAHRSAMSKPIAVALCAASLTLLAAASAAGSDGVSDGVHVRTVDDGVVVSFGDSAAKWFRRVRGRAMTVACTRLGTAGALVRVDQSDGAAVRAPRRRRPVRVPLPSHRYDLCEIGRAGAQPFVAVGLTARGRAYVDERDATARMLGVMFLATGLASDARSWPTPERVVAAARRGVVALAAPEATPPADTVGYFSDGPRHMAVVTLSGAGRRLFIDLNGDVTSTNVLEYLDTG